MDKPTHKNCRRCGVNKSLDDFSPNANGKDGRRNHCRPCVAAARRARRAANPERDREMDRARRAADPEKFLLRERRYRLKYPEKTRLSQKLWRDRNPEAQAERVKRFKAMNPDKIAAINARFRERHPNYWTEHDRVWRERNPEKARAKWARRSALKRNASVGPVDLAALEIGTCPLCHSELDPSLKYPDPLSKSLDHIIPLVLGGSHEQSNLQWTHLRCNIRKGARLTA